MICVFYISSTRLGKFVRKLTNEPPLVLLIHTQKIYLKVLFIKQFYKASQTLKYINKSINSMLQEIYPFKGNQPGPKVVILGGVHGNEVCGVQAIRKIKDSLKIDKGELRLIIGNPKAVEQNIRYTEENLNRCFKKDKNPTGTYEEELAKEIMEHLNWAEISLDLHASNTENSDPFIIVRNNRLQYAQMLPIEIVVTGFEKFYSGDSEWYMESQGKVGVGVECGCLRDPKSTDVALLCINNFLKGVGLVEGEPVHTEKKVFDLFFQYHNKDKFVTARDFSDFEFVKKDEVMGHDGEKEVKVDRDCFVIFVRNREAGYGEAFCLLEKV